MEPSLKTKKRPFLGRRFWRTGIRDLINGCDRGPLFHVRDGRGCEDHGRQSDHDREAKGLDGHAHVCVRGGAREYGGVSAHACVSFLRGCVHGHGRGYAHAREDARVHGRRAFFHSFRNNWTA